MRCVTGLAVALVLALAACDAAPPEPDPAEEVQAQEDYAESSADFDREQVEPFLQRLSSALDAGFGPEEIARVLTTLDRLSLDEEAELEFSVVYQGETVPLDLTLALDEPESPDLYFFTSPALAARLDALMDQLAQELEPEPESEQP